MWCAHVDVEIRGLVPALAAAAPGFAAGYEMVECVAPTIDEVTVVVEEGHRYLVVIGRGFGDPMSCHAITGKLNGAALVQEYADCMSTRGTNVAVFGVTQVPSGARLEVCGDASAWYGCAKYQFPSDDDDKDSTGAANALGTFFSYMMSIAMLIMTVLWA